MSTFPYFTTLPNPPNDPADDVSGMQTNTGSIGSLIAEDHIGFNIPGGGLHKQVTFFSNNVPTLPTTYPELFTNLVGSLPQLFFYSGTAADSSSQYVLQVQPGSTMLLGGVILKWGNANANSPAAAAVFASAFPNACFGVWIQGFNSAYLGSFVATSVTTAGFSCLRTTGSGNTGVYYLAIGF